ncbi:MAG TPA: ATP-grasp fold amidoligase family protein [Agriterribacter sp.]|nr:ATP-grasp fold amidoligase family protein [Agriterribacter sp.]
MSDRLYLKLLFPLGTGYRLNLKNPQTYNQKLQWLNLNYRDPLLCKLADKHDVKNYVKEMIGEEYVVKSYGVWRSFEEIDFNTLPAQFVLKTTHDSGGIVICKDKSTLDLEKAREKINRHLKKNLFYTFREWVYKNIEPRIIAEEFLVDESKVELKDYKFFCFNGEPKAMFIATGRQSGNTMFDFYDISFNHLDIIQGYPQSGKIVEKPKNYALMVELAGKLSKGLPHVRIDFYNIDGKILFGEYTFFHFAGIEPFQPQKWDYEFGSWIDLDALVNNKKK